MTLSFHKKIDFMEPRINKNTVTPFLQLEIEQDRIEKLTINGWVMISLDVNIINEGIETKNELMIIGEREDVDNHEFIIKDEYPV